MKTIKNLLFVFTLFILTSCAPKVMTDIVKHIRSALLLKTSAYTD